jgi:hypothetical protein
MASEREGFNVVSKCPKCDAKRSASISEQELNRSGEIAALGVCGHSWNLSKEEGHAFRNMYSPEQS